jgi:hypothetical protein
MLLSRAQRPLATTSLVVRDEEAAGSNPVTPTSVPAGQRPLPELVRASLAASTAAKYRKYRNKSEHLTFSSNGFLQPAQRFARDEEAAS